MSEFKKIAVFCGASSGTNPVYIQCAKQLGEEMVRRKIGLVYGGGNVGLMGAIAETVGNGLGEDRVLGVIPKALAPREISGTTVGEIRLVDDMHSRKALMFSEADAFIAIPGGFGTLDETIEITTWQQLVRNCLVELMAYPNTPTHSHILLQGFHEKPVGILNMNGFFDHLLAFMDHATEEGFIRQASRDIVQSDTDPAALIDKLLRYTAPPSLIRLASEGKLRMEERG